ncbi:phosphoribosylamine--glycine ligase [Nitrosococcus wardiae]|uniref:Phosphoribosylamine--glycine ligase n=1 Tax=Nitrosococcus wardiae TaxID=1814290 RepID=A0A4P7BYL1_9GAMM|nr:phosphoribosylamine--glycine ligase [Nitrosococcus wardiae]QBQ54260.1 phosphoribosylamine--glycine ligase [Nitrosococcus wardiae]
MKILVIGGGGREHALAWKLAQSPQVDRVYVAPGNAGTALEPKLENVAIKPDNIPALVAFASAEQIGLTVVGPEAPLVLGIVDAFEEAGLGCLGPYREAARLEGAKSFAKDFLMRCGIPTARYRTFSEVEPAVDYIKMQGAPIVVKVDGLAAGKGVVVAQTEQEAIDAVHGILAGGAFGEAGRRVVIEEFLRGEEASFIVLTDGEHILPLASSQDHKAHDQGDTGPNTGGMGAYSPASVVTEAVHKRVMQEIIVPTVRGMAEEGYPYRGFLYAGLMIAEDGSPKVLEYNCRFGDPEAQPIMMRLQSDLVELCQATLEGRLHEVDVTWDPRAALGVVMAAKGYPGSYPIGDPIYGLPAPERENSKVFYGGTAEKEGRIVTAGGRVLCVCGLGDSVTQAQATAYALVQQITWKEAYYRTDIGYRAIAKEAGRVKGPGDPR